MKFSKIESFLQELHPLKNAENWDNVGFIFGRKSAEITKIITCLTITPEVVKEAKDSGANLIVSHHPFPFRKVNRLTDDTFEGEMILDLASAGVNIYSPHTAFDSATGGINEQTLVSLDVASVQDLIPKEGVNGAGRYGDLSEEIELQYLIEKAKKFYGLSKVKVVGNKDKKVKRLASACGSGGDFFSAAKAKGADVLITGEANFHTCIAAKAYGIALILTGHFASERFAVERLAEELSSKFPEIETFASKEDVSPIEYF